MLCPRCSSSMQNCIDSRPSKEGTRRRRVCMKCGERFSTYEIGMERFKELKLKAQLLDDLMYAHRKVEDKLKRSEE